MNALYILLACVSFVCAVQAVRASRLLHSALWLAALSAFVSIWLYLLGAREIAVIELSVGAGLVTVLLAFVIGLAGDEPFDARPLIPAPLAFVMVAAGLMLLGAFVFPVSERAASVEPSFSAMLWQGRGLDLLAQLALIFAGVLGVRALLSETDVRLTMPDYRLLWRRHPADGSVPVEPGQGSVEKAVVSEERK